MPPIEILTNESLHAIHAGQVPLAVTEAQRQAQARLEPTPNPAAEGQAPGPEARQEGR